MTQRRADPRNSIAPVAPHLGPVIEEAADRDRFTAPELAIVLSHYDLGVIQRVWEYRRGSRRSPKVRISAERGELLLKRRAPGRDDPYRVAFAQDLQLFLATRGFPVAEIVGTRTSNSSMLQHAGRIYELFHFVDGARDSGSAKAAERAGRALGRFHRLLEDHAPSFPAPAGSYHAVAGLDAAMDKIPAAVQSADAGASVATVSRRCAALREVYHDAARQAEAAGLTRRPPGIVHGDWHPGNLVYRDGDVVAVLDFDSARSAPRVTDVANAALQFSMKIDDPERPEAWPAELDVRRMQALLRGYDETAGDPVTVEERQALPWLILEALILESVVPIAATGRFATIGGDAFLGMVERKVRWLRPRAEKLIEYLAG